MWIKSSFGADAEMTLHQIGTRAHLLLFLVVVGQVLYGVTL